MLYEIISEYGFSSQQVDEVVSLLDSETGKYIQSSSHRIIKNRKWLIIAPGEVERSDIVVVDAVGN